MCKYLYFPSLLKGFAKREILSLELIFLNKNLYEISLLLIFFLKKVCFDPIVAVILL